MDNEHKTNNANMSKFYMASSETVPFFQKNENYKLKTHTELKTQKHGKFTIKNEIIRACITTCYDTAHGTVSGFTQGKNTVGYMLLVYLGQLALGFRRLPFCEDRVYENFRTDDNSTLEYLKSLTPKTIEEAVIELRSLYEFTQIVLKEQNITEVCLERGISNNFEDRYAFSLAKLKAYSQFCGRDIIRFDMDFLNSFGDDGAYAHHDVRLKFTVPAKNILYCSYLIDEFSAKTEVAEWVVINDSITGMVDCHIDNISVARKDFDIDVEKITKETALRYINTKTPFEWRSRTREKVHIDTSGSSDLINELNLFNNIKNGHRGKKREILMWVAKVLGFLKDNRGEDSQKIKYF